MIDPRVKEETIKVAEMLQLLAQKLTDAANSDDIDVLHKVLAETADALESAGAMLALGLKGGPTKVIEGNIAPAHGQPPTGVLL